MELAFWKLKCWGEKNLARTWRIVWHARLSLREAADVLRTYRRAAGGERKAGANREMGFQTERWTDRQTDTETDRQTVRGTCSNVML